MATYTIFQNIVIILLSARLFAEFATHISEMALQKMQKTF